MLADKPWILTSADLPALEAALADADRKRVVAYDIMTERFEVTSILQRALVNDAAVYGEQLKGTPGDPAVYMESVHHLMKVVSGAPNIRPAWFFDTDEQGEGLNDIGTHLVDLVQWTLFPNQPVDYRADVKVLSAYRWPTMIPEAEFKRVTASDGFPASLAARVKGGQLEYFCNTYVTYTVKGVHTALNVPWDWEAPAGAGDTHYAVYKGSRAKVEVRQSKADNYRTEVYVVPNAAADRAQVLAPCRPASRRCRASGQASPWTSGTARFTCRSRRASAWDTRRTSRRSRGTSSATCASAAAAGLGAAEHAGEVLRDDDGDGTEPQGADQGGEESGAVNCRLQIADCGLQIADYADCGYANVSCFGVRMTCAMTASRTGASTARVRLPLAPVVVTSVLKFTTQAVCDGGCR